MNLEQIRDLRRQKGISQAQLAELVGCSQPTISLIERGQTPANPALLRRIIEILAPEDSANAAQRAVNQSGKPTFAVANTHPLKIPVPSLPKFLTINQWKRPDFSGDFAVCHVYQKGRSWSVCVVAVDIAGSGIRMMQSSAYLAGWIRGTLASRQQPILEVIESFSSECRRLELEASVAGIAINGREQEVGVDIEVVTAAFPPPLVVSDPPFRTESIGAIGPALPLRESEYLSLSRSHMQSGALVITTDGILERIGGGSQPDGRRAIVKHLTSSKRHVRINDWLSTAVPPRDDELAMVIEYHPWDIDELVWVRDDRERLRVQRSLEQLLNSVELWGTPDGQARRAQLAATAVAELIDNVRQHARGSDNVIVRAVRNTDYVRIEIVDDGIGPPPAKIVNDRNGVGVFELIRQVSDHLYVEEANPRGCLVGMVLNTLS